VLEGNNGSLFSIANVLRLFGGQMAETIMDLTIVFDFILLIGLVIGMRLWQKRHGRLTEKRFSLLFTGFWTFFTITVGIPLFTINVQVAIVVEAVLLLGFWGIGYPFTRWLYRHFTSSRKIEEKKDDK
jgi:hypothetical protein